jgi:hypothetical protein
MEGITVIHNQSMPSIKNHQQTTDSLRRGPPKLKPLNLPAWVRFPNPTAQLKVLRDPRNMLKFDDEYMSPTQGNSDAYTRFLVKQVRKHESCDCLDTWGGSRILSVADLKRQDAHRFFESLQESAWTFMGGVRISEEMAKMSEREALRRQWGQKADICLSMVLKADELDLDLEKWRSISKELREATRKREEAALELARAEAQNGLFVQFENETESEPEGAATPFSNSLDISGESDTDTDSDSNDDFEEDEEDEEETSPEPKEPAEFNNYPDVIDDSNSDSSSDYDSEDEDDFSHFYNYREEGESSTTVDITEFPASPKPTSENGIQLASPPSEPEIDQPEHTWTLKEYEAYLKWAIVNYDATKERHALRAARLKFLAVVRPKQQYQLQEHPCKLTVIPNRKLRSRVPEPEHQPLPTIRLITPRGIQLKIEPQLSPLPDGFDEYVRERDAAQEDMQYERDAYFAGEPSAVWEKRIEKENRLEGMKKFHAFMERENIPYPNFSQLEKLESLKRPAMEPVLDIIAETPEEEAATRVEYARVLLELAQQRLDKALNKKEKFREVLIPATIKIRAEINKEIEAQTEKWWEEEGRWGVLKERRRTQDEVDAMTGEWLKYLLINMLAVNEYRVDPNDNLTFIAKTGEIVTFAGGLREKKTWAYPLSLLPTAIQFAKQYYLLPPEAFEKHDAFPEVRFLCAEAGLQNMRKGSDWYHGLRDAAKRARKEEDKVCEEAWGFVSEAFGYMHDSFPQLPCEEWEVPTKENRNIVVGERCERIKAKWDLMRREWEDGEMEKEMEEADTEMVDIELEGATMQAELADATKRTTDHQPREESPKRTRANHSVESIFGPKKEIQKTETTILMDSWDGKEVTEESDEHKAWKRGTEVARGACQTS